MVWLKEICEDVVCGGALGIVKGVFGISLFTETETEEINSLKELALSVLEKSPEIAGQSVCACSHADGFFFGHKKRATTSMAALCQK